MADIFQQDRLLIDGVEMKISLPQSKDAFCFIVVYEWLGNANHRSLCQNLQTYTYNRHHSCPR